MIRMDVRTDISRALSRLQTISDDVQGKAIVRALNKTADQVKVQSAREIRDAGYNLKIGKIKQAIDIRRANKGTLVAVVKATGRPIGLINYSARQVKNGVIVQVKNGRKLIRHAFIATMPNGHVGVFIRGDIHTSEKKVWKGQRTKKQYKHGLPMDELFGPSIPSTFMNNVVQSALQSAVREKFPRLFRHEIEYLRLKN